MNKNIFKNLLILIAIFLQFSFNTNLFCMEDPSYQAGDADNLRRYLSGEIDDECFLPQASIWQLDGSIKSPEEEKTDVSLSRIIGKKRLANKITEKEDERSAGRKMPRRDEESKEESLEELITRFEAISFNDFNKALDLRLLKLMIGPNCLIILKMNPFGIFTGWFKALNTELKYEPEMVSATDRIRIEADRLFSGYDTNKPFPQISFYSEGGVDYICTYYKKKGAIVNFVEKLKQSNNYKFISLIALMYIDRLKNIDAQTRSDFLSVKKLFLCSFILALKFFDDLHFKASFWNRFIKELWTSPDGKKDFIRFHDKFIYDMDFNFNVHPEDLNKSLKDFLDDYENFKNERLL